MSAACKRPSLAGKAGVHAPAWFVLFVFLSLAGCQTRPAGPSSPAYVIPVGSRIVLHQRIEIPPNAATVRIQHGRVTDGVTRWDPSCRFEVNDVKETPQYLEPDTFTVVASQQYQRAFGLDGRNGSVRVAALGLAQFGGVFNRSREIDYIRFMKLSSETQPFIRNFICKVTLDVLGDYPTLQELQQTLGDIASIEITTPHPR